MADRQEGMPERKGRVKPIDVRNVEFEFVQEVERKNKLDEQNLTVLSEPCTPHKSPLAKKNVKSVGGTSHMGVRSTNPSTPNVPKFRSYSAPHRFC